MPVLRWHPVPPPLAAWLQTQLLVITLAVVVVRYLQWRVLPVMVSESHWLLLDGDSRDKAASILESVSSTLRDPDSWQSLSGDPEVVRGLLWGAFLCAAAAASAAVEAFNWLIWMQAIWSVWGLRGFLVFPIVYSIAHSAAQQLGLAALLPHSRTLVNIAVEMGVFMWMYLGLGRFTATATAETAAAPKRKSA